mmetsp:Transcript_24018/g.50077  ORF Transcript_24018/g.50077 Transcript_24018/m.50077 type:complete len:261 (-) Transcript_24018:3384-4166(-)
MGDVSAIELEVLGETPTGHYHRGSGSLVPNVVVTEVHATKSCGTKKVTGFNQKHLYICPMDIVKFTWLNRKRCLQITGGDMVEPFSYDDREPNARCYHFRFDKVGDYIIKNYDKENSTSEFFCYVHVRSAESHLRMAIFKTFLMFGTLIGILVCGSAVIAERMFSASGFVPDKDYEDGGYNKRSSEELAKIIKSHSAVTLILAVLVIVVGPVLALFNFLRPQPLTSYGRGFDYLVHVRVRCAMGFFSLVCFGIVLWGWDR